MGGLAWFGRKLTLGDVHCVPCETGALPHERALLRQQGWDLPAHELVAHRLPAVGVQLVRVADLPRPAGEAVVVGSRLPGRRQLRPLAVEGVSVEVLRAAHGGVGSHGVVHEYRVVRSVHVRVDPETEEMLVVVRVDACVCG